MAEARNLQIIKIHVEAIFSVGSLSVTAHKYEKEKPSVKPLASAIDEEARKQKYVNPEMNTNNKCRRSFTDNLSNIEKKFDGELQLTKMGRK